MTFILVLWFDFFPFSLGNRAAALLVEAADMGDPDAHHSSMPPQITMCRFIYCRFRLYFNFFFVNE
jgi:hypothetical protein